MIVLDDKKTNNDLIQYFSCTTSLFSVLRIKKFGHEDRQLQLEAICVCEIGQLLEDFYARSLKAQSDDPIEWAAQRAWGDEGSWWEVCMHILQKFQD